MISFLIGVLVGGVLGFVVCAVCSAAGAYNRDEIRYIKETGDENNENE